MSQFLNNIDDRAADNVPAIDFDRAVRLPGGGSTCDIYRTRWQRREVFVKRLKEPFRAKPLYLDAFDKEFDIGVGLNHPSLPEYREFHRDYIIMDYIDGTTLAEMISSNDPWLSDERHILQMLRQLVEVVDYLHRHNVVHCDIKPDNIMITANGRNLVLIDFDKSYTDALNDTSGDPSRYGLPATLTGSADIDFRGIAGVVEKLKASVAGFRLRRYSRFVKTCNSPGANCEELYAILDYTPGARFRKAALIAAASATLLCVVALWLLSSLHGKDTPHAATAAPEHYVASDSGALYITTETPPSRQSDAPLTETDGTPAKAANTEPVAITQQELHDDAKKKAAILDRRVTPMMTELHAGLDRLKKLTADSSLTGQQLLDEIRRHVDKEDEYCSETYEILMETFPGTTERAAWRILSYSKAYTGYKRRAAVEEADYRREYERRFKQEGTSPK